MPVPLIFGLPYASLSTINPTLNVDDCLQWYLYEFDESVSQKDREYFGKNQGFPMSEP